MSSERIWELAKDAGADLIEASVCLRLVSCDPSIPSEVVAGADWQDAVRFVGQAKRKLIRISALASEYRADGEPVEMEEGD